jgi:hypothetical protein
MNSLKIWFLMVQAKLTVSTLISPDKKFLRYPVDVHWDSQ